MTPAEYLSIVVLPTLAEFMAEPANQRRAYLACIAAAHLVDHVARQTKDRPAKGRVEDLVRDHVYAAHEFGRPCLDIVEGVCNGTKHAGPGRGAAFPFKLGDERRREAFEFGKEGAGWGEGRWGKPGLSVSHEKITYFLDDCTRCVVWTFARAYPDLFDGVNLAVTQPDLDRWGEPIEAVPPSGTMGSAP